MHNLSAHLLALNNHPTLDAHGVDQQQAASRLDKIELLVLEQLKKQYSDAIYRSWFLHLKFEEIVDDTLIVSVPTKFIKEWIYNNYLDCINKVTCSLASIKKVNIIVREALITPTTNPNTALQVADNDIYDFVLDPLLLFDNFIVDESNKVAYSMAKAFAKGTQATNLLYIQGNIGMGKTHLLQSITARARECNRKVIYLNTEKFVQLYIKAIRDNNLISFKEQLRTADILLIDDLQFICGKNSSEQELTNTICALTESNKQVILASTSSPYDLNLDARMKSRLNGGLVVNITQANYSLRLSILESKVKRLNIRIAGEILQLIAQSITSSIREVEGAFNKLVSYCKILGQAISLDAAKEILQDNIIANSKQVGIDHILEHVADFYKVKVTDIKSKSRAACFVLPRQVVAYIAKQITSYSLQEIGYKLGNKDHATVVYSVKKIEEKISCDPAFANLLSKMTAALKS